MVQTFFIKYLAVFRHALASSFLLFRVPALGLQMLKNFSVMQRLHFFVIFEYGLARAIIFQVTAKSVLVSFRDQMCLLNSVAFLFFSFLNEVVWLRNPVLNWFAVRPMYVFILLYLSNRPQVSMGYVTIIP